ncbi:MAG: retention module-containing protein, partial [Castellaniella sp.]
MATDTVLITHITGKAWMRAPDGTMVALHEGMRVPVDARIMTDEGASVTLQATGVPPVIVGQNTDMLVSDDLAAAQPQPADNAVTPPADPVVDQVLAALDAGQDPFAILDPTAAVLTGGGGGGASFTRLSSVVETTSPLGLAYPRPGVETPEIVQLGGVAATADAVAPAVDNGVTLVIPPAQPPEEGGENGPAHAWTGDYTVFESGLPGGSNPDAADRVVESFFTIQAPDGLNATAALVLGYTDAAGQPATRQLTSAELTALGSTQQSIVTQYGTMELNGYSVAADGTITVQYTYTLTHAPDVAGDQVTDSLTVTAVDVDGDSSGAQPLDIVILDDAPTAHADVDSVAAGQFTAETGNVITGAGTASGTANADVQGADGAHVSAIKSEYSSATTSTPDGSGNLVIAGQYGVLT